MIYLDNAATSFPKPKPVIKEVTDCIRCYCGNPGRSSHRLSIKTSEKIYEAREVIADFFGVSNPERIVFTQNATHALNLAIKTTIKPGSHVIISDIEHNSVVRPIYALTKEIGVEYSVFNSKGDIRYEIEKLITPKTTAIISTLASNVFGRRISLELLGNIAKEKGLDLIVDASQLAGHSKIDLMNVRCNVLCAPGHKALFGIQGSGFALILDDNVRKSFVEGGSGNESMNKEMPSLLPERFEAGTLNAPAIVSLLSGIKFINSIGIDEIELRLNTLSARILDMLDNLKGITVYGDGRNVISFNIGMLPSSIVSEELDNLGICTRSGLHCAPSAHSLLGTLNQGTVRISLSCLNTLKDTETFYKALKSINKKYI